MARLTVVIPVHNHADLLTGCLDSIVPQADALDAEVLVVDDGSTDDTAAVAAERGARVLRRPEPGGPYTARNEGWRASDASLVAFTDARCRARPGWLAALRDAMDDSAVAIAGGDTHTLPGPGPAARFAHRRQALLAAPALAHDFLPYLPTCNLVTRRSTLERVERFTEIFSGGDVDFSWRVQLAGLGQVTFAPGADMDWQPRANVREVVRQYWKYGQAWTDQTPRFVEHGFEPDHVPRGAGRVVVRQAQQFLRSVREGVDPASAAVESLCWSAYRIAYRRASLRAARGAPAGIDTSAS